MKKFVITTDTAGDLGQDYLEKNNIQAFPLYYIFDNTTYGDEVKLEPKEFYEKLRNGILPVTSAVNPDYAGKAFNSLIEQGYDILHIAFSSALSGSYNSAAMVAREICEENPQAKITVVDTLAASLGQGLLVDYAVKMKEEGKSLDEIANWLEENKLKLCHLFTVNDLFHLHRGGRVSKTSAFVGSLINVKPILKVDNDGKLHPFSKVRGRKKSLISLVNEMETAIENYDGENKTVFISHGDCIDDANYLADLIRERFNIKDIYINYVSPTIGSHSGAGTIALFFMANQR